MYIVEIIYNCVNASKIVHIEISFYLLALVLSF